MFAKPTKAETGREAADAQPRKPLAASLIAQNVVLDGDLASDGDVQLDGVIRGDVRVERLTIGETGAVEGAIIAEAVEVRGRVTGAIAAKTVRLFDTARVDGDVTHEQLAVEAGAHFSGRSIAQEAPPAEPLALVAGSAAAE